MSTVVAVRQPDGVLIAADKQMSYHSGTVTKLFKINRDDSPLAAVGGTGDSFEAIVRLAEWLMGTESKDNDDGPEGLQGMNLLAVFKDGRIGVSDTGRTWMPIEEEYYAVGSGADYAMGAFFAGATWEQALEAAMVFDPNSGQGVDYLFIPN